MVSSWTNFQRFEFITFCNKFVLVKKKKKKKKRGRAIIAQKEESPMIRTTENRKPKQ
jgi:hypothetical protein